MIHFQSLFTSLYILSPVWGNTISLIAYGQIEGVEVTELAEAIFAEDVGTWY